ncbi:hypothetical protein MYA_1321 [Burkholderia sp. KJ006]|nr:hypothetical protein MYA_1321 [Burkholderia sp. KJ006]
MPQCTMRDGAMDSGRWGGAVKRPFGFRPDLWATGGPRHIGARSAGAAR